MPTTVHADRFTDTDRSTALAAMGDAEARWRAGSMAPKRYHPTDLEGLIRIGAHSIGCGLHDLRDSEIAWLRQEGARILDLF